MELMDHIKKTKRMISTGISTFYAVETYVKIPMEVENVHLLDRSNSRKPSKGNLYLTATHLIFIDSVNKKEYWILHMHISSVEKLPLSTQGSPLQLKCKTFLTVTFVIPQDRDCHDVYTTLSQLSQPVQINELYCFYYTDSDEESKPGSGWDMYNVKEEYARMGVPNECWVSTVHNRNYEICDTYPQELFVPATAPTKVILSSSKFRSKGRFPVLTYLHKNQAALCRCSQPLSGFSARCVEDEQLLDCILRTNPDSKYMYVVDTRPKINAMANRAAGKGYENENFYENIKFHFSGIENIHVMRSSLNKLVDACQSVTPTMSSFLSGLENCGWLKHVRAVLETGSFIANELASGTCVLVHCSDGWDRTAQTCALAQLLLDPYYRTIIGFQILIEKEWLSFGHKFTDRCGHIQGDSKEVSPIFSQFLDCVYQLMHMYPSAFEFNERYLLVLHDHVFSAQFGTFIGNCQKDRIDLRLSEYTYSLWGFMKRNSNQHKNPLYRKDSTPDIIKPNLTPQNIKFWRGLYNRFENGVHPREPLGDLLAATQEHSLSLEDNAEFLTKRLNWLKEQLAVKGKTNNDTSCDNRILHEKGLANGDVRSDPLFVMDMRSLEDSLPSTDTSTASILQSKPVLTQTSPDKLTTTITSTGEKLTLKNLPTHLVSAMSVVALTPLLSTMAVDWKSFRHLKECSCSTPFDHFSRKFHCWRCGEVFCTRCIDRRACIPGHLSQSLVPVCHPCYKDVTRSLSVDTP